MATHNELRFRRQPYSNGTCSKTLAEPKTNADKRNNIYGKRHILGIFTLLATLTFIILRCDQYLPNPKPITAQLTDFSAERSRVHLDEIIKFGPRPSGSYACDVQTVNYLLKVLNSIKSVSNKALHIEIELQTASGTFAYYRKDTKLSEKYGETVVYDTVHNVIVRLSPRKNTEHYVLANAHFDTEFNTVGASDDTVNCAILIESFRALSQLDATQLQHGVVYLFNGGEEGSLSGAHAFVKHRWFSAIDVVVNIEAAGSGGREIVFQTGPGHSWLLSTYAETAKYPFATVLAQEIFQSELSPMDTDFRVFQDYGNIVGVDIAFIKNGYIYHTKYDDGQLIPNGSIQRAGDNIHELIKGIANSEYLEQPEKYKHGSSVFFDVLGVFMIHYPKRVHLLTNWLLCVAVFLYTINLLLKKRFSSAREHFGLKNYIGFMVSPKSLLQATLIILLSWVLALTIPLLQSLTFMRAGLMMTWFSNSKFALLLYGVPALFGLCVGHYIGHKYTKKGSPISMESFIYAHILIYSVFVVLANREELSSSFLLSIWLFFPFIFLCLLPNHVINHSRNKTTTLYIFHLLGVAPPALITMYHLDMLMSFLGPVSGFAGDRLPIEVVMAMLSAVAMVIVFTYFMTLYHNLAHKKKVLLVLGVMSVLPTIAVLTGCVFPYSAQNPRTPKRLYLNHMKRRFHAHDGSIIRQDSGIWIQPVDALGFSPLKDIDFFKNTEEFLCDGSYCGLPYFYAKREMIARQWYLRGEEPSEIMNNVLTTNVYQRTESDDGWITFQFKIKGPEHIGLFLTLQPGVTLDWSFYKTEDNHIYNKRDYMGKNGRVYVVGYNRGYKHEEWTFWIKLKSTTQSSVLAELGIAQHHTYGEKKRTRFLNATINALPDWAHESSWCSNYDHFILRMWDLIQTLTFMRVGLMMTCFSNSKFALLLYGVPALFGLCIGHYIGHKYTKKGSPISMESFIYAHILIYSVFVVLANREELSSSFLISIWLFFPFIFLCLLPNHVINHPRNKTTTLYIFHLLGVAPPALITMYHLDMLMSFLGPVSGFAGDRLPIEVVMAMLSAVAMVIVFTYFMTLYHNLAHKKKVLLVLGVMSVLPTIAVLSGCVFPYSAQNPRTPKRLYLNHMMRRFHDHDGSIIRQDSGIWIQPVDALGFSPLKDIDFFKNTEEFLCDGSYCGLPYFYAKREMIARQWYLRGEEPSEIMSNVLTTNVYQRTESDDGWITFKFKLRGPEHIGLFITLQPGVTLDWSFYKTEDNHIYNKRDYMGKNGRVYVVAYNRGYKHEEWTFWIKLKSTIPSSVLAELGIAQHHTYGEKKRTRLLNATINALPDWAH